MFALALGVAYAADSSPSCKTGEYKTVKVGIVQAAGCWAVVNKDGQPVVTAAFDNQLSPGLDMNGFILTGPSGGGVQINTDTQRVQSVAVTSGNEATKEKVQLNSRGWPVPGATTAMGEPIKLDFTAPNTGPLLLEDFKIGTNNAFVKALAGFSPVGGIETPVQLEDDGKGSMDLTLDLGGVYTLKGKDQSATVRLPTEIGKGTTLDGFSIKLKEIDSFKVVKIEDFDAEYSAAQKKLAGGATVVLPFMGDPTGKNGKGITASFAVEDGTLSELTVGESGLEIPIGSPPGGYITAMSGGFEIHPGQSATIKANMSADLGKKIPLPWGEAAPVALNAGIKVGAKGNGFYFRFDGGIKLFSLDVGGGYVEIETDTGMQFGASIGLGVPSFRNNDRDTFYVGAYVNGWIGKGMFQFKGGAKIRAFSIPLIQGDLLINNRAIGACWVIAWLKGGVVYEYGKSVRLFDVNTCGLGAYEEKYPGASAMVSGASRQLRLSGREKLIRIKGDGGVPGFTLRSEKGRVLKSAVGAESFRRKNNAILLDPTHDQAFVVMHHPAGNWTLTPTAGSPPITDVHTNGPVPSPKVRARVIGKGLTRTLVWNSKRQPNTELVFTEKMRGGFEQPILSTRKAHGKRKFRVTKGTHYGKRRLRVLVVHGNAPREERALGRYVVRRPAKLGPPRRVSGRRSGHDVTVNWTKAKGASGYLVDVVMRKNGKRLTGFVRNLGPRARKVSIPKHPGGGRAIARVYALNADGVPGPPRIDSFPTNPPAMSLKAAARRGAKSARSRGGAVGLRTICPEQGHCRTTVILRAAGKAIGRTAFQQTPDTFRDVTVKPRSKALRRKLAKGRLENLKVVVGQRRLAGKATATARVRR